MNQFVFLVTDGDTEIMCRSWGETKADARESLERSLNPFHSIVEEVKTILAYIEEAEEGLRLLQPLKMNQSRAYRWFVEDLVALKETIAEKERVEC